VNVSQTTDEAGKPMKVITVTYDGGSTKTIQFHGDSLTIKAANPDNVVQDASVTSDITIEGLDEGTLTPEASVNGQPIDGKKQKDGSLFYDVPSGLVIDLAPTGNGKAGQDQVHEVYGDMNLTVMNSDTVEVQPNIEYDPINQRDEVKGQKFIITHQMATDTVLSNGFR
jgi:hypothetical protein